MLSEKEKNTIMTYVEEHLKTPSNTWGSDNCAAPKKFTIRSYNRVEIIKGVHSLGKISGIDLGEVKIEESFMDYLYSLMDKYGIEQDRDLYKKAGISPDKWNKYKNNGTLPQKEVIVSIALAMGLKMYETEGLLTRAGHALRTDSMWDVIVKACIVKRIYDIDGINEVLEEKGLDPVGPVEKLTAEERAKIKALEKKDKKKK